MNIPWRQARRLIPNLDALLAAAGPREPPAPVPGEPACTRLEVAPGRWSVTIAAWVPASDNVRGRGVKAWCRAKKRDREVVRTWVAEYARVPRATGKRRVSATVLKKGPLVDGTNLWKSLADALVNVGLLVDDGPEQFEAGPIAVARGAEAETTLLLEDLP